MSVSSFAAVVSTRLDPVLAPRGFPYAGHENGVAAPGEPPAYNPDSALFHGDGPEAVAAVLARYPGWSTRLHRAYGPQEIVCLDLWVQQDGGQRSWTIEDFEREVLEVAGADARRRFASLEAGPLEEWTYQLALMLDRYFSRLEAGGPDIES